jgi:hypothetical protein
VTAQDRRQRFAQLFSGLRQQGRSRTSATLCALLFLVLLAGEAAAPASQPMAAPVVCAPSHELAGSIPCSAEAAAKPRYRRVQVAHVQLPPPPLRQRSILDGSLPPVRAPDC